MMDEKKLLNKYLYLKLLDRNNDVRIPMEQVERKKKKKKKKLNNGEMKLPR